MEAPTAAELLANPIVRQALDEAWNDSMPNDPITRHEEGGWIYLDPASGDFRVRRAPRGGQAVIDLQAPPVIDGSFVVGKFHTHPNPTVEGWEPGPSPADLSVDVLHGVPDLIRADDGIHLSGPNQRRGGLTGEPGYPA